MKPEDVEEYLLETHAVSIEEFITLLAQRETKKAIETVEKAAQKGLRMENLIENLLSRLRMGLLAKVGIGSEDLEGFSKDDLVLLINLFSKAGSELKGALISELPVELAIIEWGGEKPENSGQKNESSGVRERAPGPTNIKEITDEIWRTILSQVKPINTSIEALLRAAKPISYDGKILTLGVYYRFHKERLEEGSHRRVLEDVASGVLGAPVRVICTLTEPAAKKVANEEKSESVLTEGEDKDIIKIAEEIFGN